MSEIQIVESKNAQQVIALTSEYRRLDEATTWKKAELFARWKRETSHTDEEIAGFCGCTRAYVGLLRRTWEDFGQCYETFTNLSVAHFMAVLGWDDAEIWLAAAQKRGWSKHQMCHERDKLKNGPKVKPEKPKGPQPKALADYQAAVRKKQQQEEGVDDDPEEDDIEEDIADTGEESEPAEETVDADQSRPVFATKPPTPKNGAVFDKNGQQVPPQLQPIFQTSPLLESLERDLESVARKAKELDEDIKDTNYVFDNRLEVILGHIENAKREIRFAAPYVLCTHCNGAGCKECRTKGWVEQETWKRFKKG